MVPPKERRSRKTEEDFQIQTPEGLVEAKFSQTERPAPGPGAAGQRSGPFMVSLQKAALEPTSDLALWVVIRNSTNALSFDNYLHFIDDILCCPKNLEGKEPCGTPDPKDKCASPFSLSQRRSLPFPDMDPYRLLKVATECFEMCYCGVYIDPGKLKGLVGSDAFADQRASLLSQGVSDVNTLWQSYLKTVNGYEVIPYLALIRTRLGDLSIREDYKAGLECYGILRNKLVHPCLIELIWSYWHEEGMLVQTLNAISRRFQNFRGPANRDPLTRFDIDPLRPMNNLLWGYIQDEQHRLTVRRRAYEYNHEYGFVLEGKAVPAMRPTDTRSKFLEAFHNLLYLCTIFFKEDDDTTVIADGFPVLNALKEVHYILAAGAHNQFGDLPSTARQEMLMQQWLLARPEMREFLGGKVMVPYPEPWMDPVDNVKSMGGWTDVSVVHFHDLAVYGEQLVLSIRYGAWSPTTVTATQAANWARYWRNEIQGYIHAYRAVTGADLTTEPVNATLPSVLLSRRLAAQRPAGR